MLSIDAWLDEKPYKELYDGVVREKVSPQSDHSLVMLRFGRLLDDWAAGRGWVGVEWRLYPRDGITLVPDIAFISDARLAPLSRQARQKPPLAPDIAIEIRSPDDRGADVDRKTSLYLELGTTLVINVDPARRVVRLTDRERDIELDESATLDHSAFEDLRIPIEAIFATIRR